MTEGAREHGVHVQLPRCPFCHEDVRAEEEKLGCTSCMAWHHAECLRESGGRCATCSHVVGTVEAPPREAPEPVSVAEVSQPPAEDDESDVEFNPAYGAGCLLGAVVGGFIGLGDSNAMTAGVSVGALVGFAVVPLVYEGAVWFVRRRREGRGREGPRSGR